MPQFFGKIIMCWHELSYQDIFILDLIHEFQPRASATVFEGQIYVYGELLASK